MAIETPTGTVDGTNVEFRTAQVPVGEQLFVDRVLQYPGLDYTLSGTTITFTYAPPPGALLRIYYNQGTSTPLFSVTTEPVEAADGVLAAFTVTTPGPVRTEQVYVDRLLQIAGKDYVVSGGTAPATATFTFTAGAIPPLGALFRIFYSWSQPQTNAAIVETVAPAQSATLSAAPISSTLRVNVDRILQIPGLDYLVSGSTVSFLAGAVPPPNSIVMMEYRVSSVVVGTQPGQAAPPGTLVLPSSIGVGKWCNDSEITDMQNAVNAILQWVAKQSAA